MVKVTIARTTPPVSVRPRLLVKAARPRLLVPRPPSIVCCENSARNEPSPFDVRSESPVSVLTPRTGLRRELAMKMNKQVPMLSAAIVVSATPPAAANAVVSPASPPVRVPIESTEAATFFGVPRNVATFSATPSAGRAYALFSPSNVPASGAALRAVLRKRIAHTLWSSPSLCSTYGIKLRAAMDDSDIFLSAVDDAAAKIEAALWTNLRLHASVAGLSSAELAGEMCHAVVKQEAAEIMLVMAY